MAQGTIATKIDDFQRLYRTPEQEKVMPYLTAHPELVEVLLEARPHIDLQFGRDAVVEVRFPRYHEGDYQGELLAMIQSDLDSDAALESFDRFWDEWWGDASGRQESWPLYFGVEFAGERMQ